MSADVVQLHEPETVETLLQQLLQLMKNVVVNHERIRARILELKERYFKGEMRDGATNWEKWAVAHFAYSERYLRFLSSPHPLNLSRAEAQRARAQEQLRKEQQKADRIASQAAWDEWKKGDDEKTRKRLRDKAYSRRRRQDTKKSPVSQNLPVIDSMVSEYRALPKTDQNLFLDRIGCIRRSYKK